MIPSAKVIADSVSPLGIRLTTFEVVMHRFVLAEFNTHRVFSRNSASSRAIPLRRKDGRGTLDRFEDAPAWPVAWPQEKPGMQGGGDLEGDALQDAMALFADWHSFTTSLVDTYLVHHPDPEERLHKSLVNRLMEPLSWHKVIVTSTEWDNFFAQRASEFSPLAQPELRAAVDPMLKEYRASQPQEVDYGEWHLPYIMDEDREWVQENSNGSHPNQTLRKISAARCARVSYLTQDGQRDPAEDIALWERLTSASPMHASPLEHPATPATSAEVSGNRVPGNLHGWHQHRHEVQPHFCDTPLDGDPDDDLVGALVGYGERTGKNIVAGENEGTILALAKPPSSPSIMVLTGTDGETYKVTIEPGEGFP